MEIETLEKPKSVFKRHPSGQMLELQNEPPLDKRPSKPEREALEQEKGYKIQIMKENGKYIIYKVR